METSQIARSFASLVAGNEGKFKSEKQAKFLLSMCSEDNKFVSSGEMWGNIFTNTYLVDEIGVISVTKYTSKAGNEITWTRPEAGILAVQQIKELKRLTKMLKATKLNMLQRKEAFEAGKYSEYPDLFTSCQDEDAASLLAIQAKIDQIK